MMIARSLPVSAATIAGRLVCLAVLLPSPAIAQSETQHQPPPAVGKTLEKVPQTADEKSKVLNDLYAYLATAANEQDAKPIADAIERLWLQSGSDTISLLMERSSVALAAKNSELALQLLNAVVALAPDFAEGFNRRAYINFSQGNIESAVGDLRRALALEPNHFKALDGLAQIWREHGNKKGALRVYKQLLEVHPNWPSAKQAVDELTREVEGQGI